MSGRHGGDALMLEPVSVGLKFGFLAILYLFLLWVVRSALKDLRRGPNDSRAYSPPSDATGMYRRRRWPRRRSGRGVRAEAARRTGARP